MNNLFDRINNLFNPEKKPQPVRKRIKEKVFYKTGNQKPFTKRSNITQQRIDEILDKMNQKGGYHLLTDEEKTIASLISKEAGADFVKTSTGFASGGATVHDVALMRKAVGPEMGVKASGGVRTYEDAENMIKAGATRIGASAGVKIIQGPSDQASAGKEAGSSSAKSY